MNRAIFLTIASFLLAALPLSASSVSGGCGAFMIGFDMPNLGNLNDKLEANGYGSFDNKFLATGGFGYAAIKSVILGGEGAGESQIIKNDSLKAKLSAGYGLFDIGYVVFSSPVALIFPVVGIGGGGIDLTLWRTDMSLQFDSILANPGITTVLNTGGLILKGEFDFLFFPPLGKGSSQPNGIMLGVRVGYMYMPQKASWKFEDIDVSDGPDSRLNGLYIHFMIGMGGFFIGE